MSRKSRRVVERARDVVALSWMEDPESSLRRVRKLVNGAAPTMSQASWTSTTHSRHLVGSAH